MRQLGEFVNGGDDKPRARVLIVDDEDSILFLSRTVLERSGFHVATASDFNSALEVEEAEGEFDVAVIDLTLPGGCNGVALNARLHEKEPALRAIASSGYHHEPAMREPQEHGFEASLLKPFTLNELVEKVNEVRRGTVAA